MGFFDKKYCDICGEKIGLLGNRKLEDGNMCKDCAKKLSPWFTDRRETNIAGIKEQLAYREQNKQAVAAFNTTLQLGEEMRVYVDEPARKFMITDARDLEKENPDVFDLDNVVQCSLRIHDSQRELQGKNSRGETVSYDPPRYQYSVWFHFTIAMNHPYVDEISYQLNEYTLKIEQSGGTFFGLSMFDPREDFECRRYIAMADEICHALTGRPLTNITRS